MQGVEGGCSGVVVGGEGGGGAEGVGEVRGCCWLGSRGGVGGV